MVIASVVYNVSRWKMSMADAVLKLDVQLQSSAWRARARATTLHVFMCEETWIHTSMLFIHTSCTVVEQVSVSTKAP